MSEPARFFHCPRENSVVLRAGSTRCTSYAKSQCPSVNALGSAPLSITSDLTPRSRRTFDVASKSSRTTISAFSWAARDARSVSKVDPKSARMLIHVGNLPGVRAAYVIDREFMQVLIESYVALDVALGLPPEQPFMGMS